MGSSGINAVHGHRSLNSFSLSFHNFLELFLLEVFNFYWFSFILSFWRLLSFIFFIQTSCYFQIPILIFISEISAWRLVFWNSIHMEVASDSFCFLVYSSWLLVFVLYVFELFFSFVNLYCWKGLHFSWNNFLILIFIIRLFLLFLASEGLLFVSFFWASFHSLCSPTLGICFGEGFYLPDPCELTFANTLLLTNAAVSLGGAFVSLEISLQFYIFFSLFCFIQAFSFISLQIKEFRIMGLSINDSVYSSVFFFLTGLHFFHLLFGLLLLGLFFWSCSFPVKILLFVNLRVSEVILFSNFMFFYWHFVEILWIFIFLVFYRL